MDRIPIIIDTDPGVDDFFCIAIACSYSERFELKGLTTIGGNNATAVTTNNALKILNLLGRNDVPVAAGSDKYMCAEFGKPVLEYHGANGLGNVEVAESPKKPIEKKAWDFIYDTAKELNGELVLVTVGPLTNVGIALQKYPELSKLIKRIVMMGGSSKEGNETPYAEANIYNDPEAASIVFGSGIPVSMIGLNVTNYTPYTMENFDSMSENLDAEIYRVMRGIIDFRKNKLFHDAIAIGTEVSDYARFKSARVKVVLNGKRRGQTRCCFLAPKCCCNARVAVEVSTEKYVEVYRKMLDAYRVK